jgi:hypothetical protein
MAKVTMPLGGFTASGQLAKAFVYFSWKGLRVVRSYVVPANPNTAEQQAARAEFTGAVTAFHASAFTAVDLSAWRRYATNLTRVMSGFNAFISRYILLVTAVIPWELLSDMLLTDPGVTTIKADIKGSVGNGATIYWGTSPTFMPNSNVMAYAAGRYTYTMTGLTAGVRYYMRVLVTSGTEMGETGTYTRIST